jgi:hypothetical protein
MTRCHVSGPREKRDQAALHRLQGCKAATRAALEEPELCQREMRPIAKQEFRVSLKFRRLRSQWLEKNGGPGHSGCLDCS